MGAALQRSTSQFSWIKSGKFSGTFISNVFIEAIQKASHPVAKRI